MASHGLKVSRDGYDVLTIPDTAANIKKFALLSGLALLKIKTSAKITIGYGVTENIAHGLDYTPIVWVFLKKGTELHPVYNDTSDTFMYVDGTNLTIKNLEIGSWPDGEDDFYYYIFYDQI